MNSNSRRDFHKFSKNPSSKRRPFEKNEDAKSFKNSPGESGSDHRRNSNSGNPNSRNANSQNPNHRTYKNSNFSSSDAPFLRKPKKEIPSYESVLIPRLGQGGLKNISLDFHSKIKNIFEGKTESNSHPSSTPNSQKNSDEKIYYSQSGMALDPWQHEAYESLMQGFHIVIDAPTSAGKTRIIEAYLMDKIKNGAKLIYTSPVKSLSNDKYTEFTEKFGRENVGINTGDFKENLGAPIILATLETYRNSLLGLEPDISRQLVVFDEYHYLQDSSRGSAWEEAIILTPKASQIVLLSASVPNCSEFAQWIYSLTDQPTKVLQVTHRPVPLTHLVHTQHGWVFASDLHLTKDEEQNLLDIKYKKGTRIQNVLEELFLPLMQILDYDLGPIVVYAARRADVENTAALFAKNMKNLNKKWDTQKIEERVKNLQGFEYVPLDLQKYILRYGVAYHHSGMIPPGRVAVETLLKEGLLLICFGTMGISLGVNFAVRSAIICDEDRPGESGVMQYSNSEILQMLGRAGRRGHDKEGFSLWMNMGKFVLQKPRQRENCTSALRFDPTTILGLLGRYEDISKLKLFYEKSFNFLHKKNIHHSKKSVLEKIIQHLQKKKALQESSPTLLGSIARCFPQSGGLVIAHFLSTGQMNDDNFMDFLHVIACFCCAHFKVIPPIYSNLSLIHQSNAQKLISEFYPYDLFPDLYDEVSSFRAPNKTIVFREFNENVGSIIFRWLDPHTTWEQVTSEHTSKYFSDGDCMNVLFRFATFLQSFSRLGFFSLKMAKESKRLWNILFREPLDARNRLLAEEIEEKDT